ncbi:MAG: hypothetical protein HYY93_13690 [Planctomycetes bacterium]|nr:hypothetical protein [Planctomycetota bacterium]
MKIEAQPINIQGVLVNEDGKPEAGVRVDLTSGAMRTEKVVASTKTDAEGRFSFAGTFEWSRINFNHEKESEVLSAHTDIDFDRIWTAEGGMLDLGTLALHWSGVRVEVTTTFEGKPVGGLKIWTPPRVNRPEPVVTDAEGKASLHLDLKKGKKIVLLADDGAEYSGWYSGTVGHPGETVNADIALTRRPNEEEDIGMTLLIREFQGGNSNRLRVRTKVYLSPEAAEDVDDRVDPAHPFRYAPAYLTVETDDGGCARVKHLPVGMWYVSALDAGRRFYSMGEVMGLPVEGQGETILMPNYRPPPYQKVGHIGGQVDFAVAGHTLKEWVTKRRSQGVQKPLRVGVFAIPRTDKGAFFLQPVVPNVVVDPEKSTDFQISGLLEGEYLVFAAGVREWPDEQQLPERWMLDRSIYPRCPAQVVKVEGDKAATVKLTGDLSADHYSSQYGTPVSVVKRYFAYLKAVYDGIASND